MQGTGRHHSASKRGHLRHEFPQPDRDGSGLPSRADESGSLHERRELTSRAENPALARIESALRAEGYANYGGDWQCPSCRCRVADARHHAHSDLSLRLVGDGGVIGLRCSHGCRENTIRAILGMAAYADDPTAPPAGPRQRGGPRH